jgi:hypothetical protein
MSTLSQHLVKLENRRGGVFAATVFLSVALLWLIAAPLHATVLVPLSPAQLSQRADSIVVAKAVAGKCRSTTSIGRTQVGIETDVSFRVQRVIKGDPSLRETVVVPGGMLGDSALQVLGAPVFVKNGTYLLFLDEHNGVVGWEQGSMRVVNGRVPQWDLSVDQAVGRIDHLLGRSVSVRGDSIMDASGFDVLRGGALARLAPAVRAALRGVRLPSVPLRVPSTKPVNVDFETDMGTFVVDGAGDNWGRSQKRSALGSWSAYCAQTGGKTTYAPSIDAFMAAGPYDFSQAPGGTLDFDVYLDAQPEDLFGCVFSIDGQTLYGGVVSDGQIGRWLHVTVDLTDVALMGGGSGSVCGESSVYVFLLFQGNGDAQVAEGAFVDNVILETDGTGGGPIPAISSISPDSGSAGTGTTVTLTGSNFGAQQGKVNFFYKGSETIPATQYDSWTNTQIVCEVPVDQRGYSRSAASGPVTVQTLAGDVSAGKAFSVPFGYTGRWPSGACTYYVNASDPTWLSLFQQAAAQWNAESSFKYTYGGSCTATDWVGNGKSEMFWTSIPDRSVVSATGYWLSGTTIGGALTYPPRPYYGPSTITEVDIGFNTAFDWGDATANPSVMDVWSIAIHELGHGLGLKDLYGDPDSSKIMYGFGSEGNISRYLTPGDKAGVAWIYASAATPVISSLNPSHGKAGDAVVVSGTNLGTSGTLKFGAITATTLSWAAGTIVATVPSGLSPGAVSVTVTSGGQTSAPSSFTVDQDAGNPPVISALNPTSGAAGTTVVITGSNFGSSGSVHFGSTSATTSSWTVAAIVCIVPSGLSPGAVSVTVTTSGGTSTALSFLVTGSLDTVGPVCAAKNATVRRGKSCKILFKVNDALSAEVTTDLVITTKSGVVKKHWSWGYEKPPAAWWYVTYKCTLAKGSYRIVVSGKDLAGNAASVIGRATLTVK